MNGRDCVSMKVNLQKQFVGQIWPTSEIEKTTVNILISFITGKHMYAIYVLKNMSIQYILFSNLSFHHF